MACLSAVLLMLANHGLWRAVAAPNFLIILADDLGFGDVGAYRSKSTLPTPHLDRLASEGMRFIDAHSPSAVCTPTRYGLLTGRYAWRSALKWGVLNGYGPPLMTPDRLTLARLLKGHGYHTGIIGKWYLGLGFALRPEGHRHPIQGGSTWIRLFDGARMILDLTRAPSCPPLWISRPMSTLKIKESHSSRCGDNPSNPSRRFCVKGLSELTSRWSRCWII